MEARRRRSPNHPRIDIQEAIELVRKLADLDASGDDMSDESVANAWGTTPTSRLFHAGSTGLRQYGLIATNNSGLNSLTDTGRALLDENSSEYDDAVNATAFYPDSLRVARNAMVHVPLTRKELVAFMQTKGFTEEAAERVVNIVVENQKYMELIGADVVKRPDQQQISVAPDRKRTIEAKPGESESPLIDANDSQQMVRRLFSEGFRTSDVMERRPGTYSYPLSRNRTVRLLFSGGEPSQRDIDLLIQYLQILNASLEDSNVDDVPF